MLKVKVTVRVKDRQFPALYGLLPSEAFELFKKQVEVVLRELPSERLTNRALKELMKKEGKKKLQKLEKSFRRLDSASPLSKKIVYSSFYRVFQRLHWAERAGSEREIELRNWITSSIDFLTEVLRVLEKRDG
ncbi:hypothetical protein [Phorcysia thermohydrogeniphila]|uniref:Uncharacterized protein n=1 Tax=Phorcysia thermohydrogeniphila TaxID=936138 RepID=A0A4R1GJY9_9BACT|nr:hypothetical protein [Phorcysia thermohydrogeniphila]TCK04592.1 hypothetical protein CLV27_1025 [Phorcysia thermohydrogeniphila]